MTQTRVFAINPYLPRPPKVPSALDLAEMSALDRALEDLLKQWQAPVGPHA